MTPDKQDWYAAQGWGVIGTGRCLTLDGHIMSKRVAPTPFTRESP